MDTKKLKEALETERQQLEVELKKIGRINPENASDWEVTPSTDSESIEFRDEVGDQIEELDTREATEVALEQRYRNIVRALNALADGSYGQCEICHQTIESDRLEANPSARTCKAHRE